MGRLLKTIAPIVLLSGAAAGFYMLWLTKPEFAAETAVELARSVTAVAVERRDEQPEMRLFGAIVAGREVELRPLVAGRIIEVGDAFADGGVVRAGDLLIAIDPFDAQSDVAEFRARVAETRARLDEITTDLAAAVTLLEYDREQVELARRDVARREKLQGTAASSVKSLDDSRLVLSLRAQQVIDGLDAGARVERQARFLAMLLDELQRPVDMRAGLGMHRDDIGAGLGKLGDERVHRRNHQMNVEGQRRAVPQGRDNVRTDRNVGDEMAVHDIDVDVIGACLVDGLHFVAEAGEIRGEDRRCDLDGLLHDSLYQDRRIAARPVRGVGDRAVKKSLAPILPRGEARCARLVGG